MKELIIYSDGVNSVEFKCSCGTPLRMKKVIYNNYWYCTKCDQFKKITIVERTPEKKESFLDRIIKRILKKNAKNKL